MPSKIKLKEKYVVGFLFDHLYKKVVLIRKTKGPSNVIGKWNGVGGKVEEGESYVAAMRREFREEAGVNIHEDQWTFFCDYSLPTAHIHFFSTNSPLIRCVTQQEGEEIRTILVTNLLDYAIVPNLQWLVPLSTAVEYLKLPIYVKE